MQNIFHTKYAFTFFIASFLACSNIFSMEKLPHEFKQAYFECRDDCKRKGRDTNSLFYGSVMRRCEKQCERDAKASLSILKIEHSLKMDASHLFVEQSKNQ